VYNLFLLHTYQLDAWNLSEKFPGEENLLNILHVELMAISTIYELICRGMR
jgi:hypothetical protein